MEKCCYPGKRLTLYLDKIGCKCDSVKAKLITETIKETRSWSDMMTPLHQAEFMKMMLQLAGSRTGLEIGTFTGLASLCLAEALPDSGKLITIDTNEKWTAIAKKYWTMAGVSHKIFQKIGPAIEVLEDQVKYYKSNYDFVYIDADKLNLDSYYEMSLQLVKTGGLIFVDNVLWDSRVVSEAEAGDEQTKAIQELNIKIKNDSRVSAVMLPISDGLTIVRKAPYELPKFVDDPLSLANLFADDDY